MYTIDIKVKKEKQTVNLSAENIISYSSPDLQKVLDVLTKNKQIVNKIINVQNEDLHPFQQQAINLVKNCNKGIEQITESLNFINKKKNSRSALYKYIKSLDDPLTMFNFISGSQLFKETIEKMKNILQQLTLQANAFSQQAKALLGRTSHLIYSPQLSTNAEIVDVPILYETTLKEIIHPGMTARIQASAQTCNQLTNVFKEIDLLQYIQDIKKIENLQRIFQQVYKRFLQHTNKSGHRIMWNMGTSKPTSRKNWREQQVINKGPLVETYAQAVFSRKAKFFTDFSQSYPENAIDDFMILFNKYDNVSGALQDDIEIEDSIDTYAIKSGNAAVASIRPILTIAIAISNKGKISEQEIISLLEKYREHLSSKLVTKSIGTKVNEAIQEMINF